MKKKVLLATALGAIFALHASAETQILKSPAAPQAATVTIQKSDFATANGSLRAGLHKGQDYAVLTGNDTDVVLVPDVYASDDENKAWTAWLSDFDNKLFDNWTKAEPGVGQQTVYVTVGPGATIAQEPMKYFGGDATAGGDAAKFGAAIGAALDKTAKSMAAMPVTKNPFKEIKYVMTFMCADKTLPISGPEALGFLAVPDDKGEVLTVYGRLIEGQAPGIQIISDKDGGNIDVTENDKFLERLKSLGVSK